jgi:tight adherence protein B
VIVALAVGGLTFAAALMLLTTHRRALVRDRLGPYVAAGGRTPSPRREGSPVARVAGSAEDVLRRLGLHAALSTALERAGMDMAPGLFVTLVAAVAGALFVGLLAISGLGAGLVGVALSTAVLWLALIVQANRRARAFEAQLPEILDMLAASLKAGHGFDQALQTIATDVDDPAAREFQRVVNEVHLGRSLDDALDDMSKRVRSSDLQFVLDAITVQRQVGGSLAELFEIVSETVRSREQFRRKLHALTGMVRASASVLTLLPFAAGLGLVALNSSYMSPLWTTSTGRILLFVGLAMMICGGLFLRRIGSVKG